MDLEIGQIVCVRSRQYLVEEISTDKRLNNDTLVRLSCLDDDAQGQQLEIFWESEINTKIVEQASWESVIHKGFDDRRYFGAYLNTLKWNCVTSTDPKLFQAPYRAGIEVKAYQLEPLRKALLQPRVSLFIADDVGLGKTIEAGLILREMTMRQKIKRVVISCPPSVVRQWKEEMESRFGLLFQVLDRNYLATKRRERGYRVNPWATYTRFIISHALLREEGYSASLRDWLDSYSSGSMLILDEAHNAAPASSSRYAIDSQLTKTVRDLAPRFEHKLFLSATPHNGHSNSFTALLEILDPQRFCRGVPINNKRLLEDVMVRRLKQDLREIGDADFPERQIIPIIIDGLSEDAPELKLARLLQDYRTCRDSRLKDASKSTQAAAMLVMTSLQKRLLSSIEAFARTLNVHRVSASKPIEHKQNQGNRNLSLLKEAPGADDERAEISETDVEIEEDSQMTAATQISAVSQNISSRELELLEEMATIAGLARYKPDSRIKRLIEWIRAELCPELGKSGAEWNERRVVIFTEYTDTKRYIEDQLKRVIANSTNSDERIETFTGGMGDERRELVKAAFNADPKDNPLRILIATDAAREGVNLQNYCSDLFHFDVPWNPSRMEQRNGRIDRKLQRQPMVHCYYFHLPQRPEDRVIDVLIKKTTTILQELGSLSPVIEKNVGKLLDLGIRAEDEQSLVTAIQEADQVNSEWRDLTIQQELETIRVRQKKLIEQRADLEDMLSKAKQWLGLNDTLFRDALSVSLKIVGAEALEPLDATEAVKDIQHAQWVLSALDKRIGADPKWANTLDTLREVRLKGETLWDWRKRANIRPVVFRDPGSLDGKVVHLHLEHRLVQRLLGRFLSQGFLHHELTRSCVCLSDDPIAKVIVLGRLSLYGERAARLHDEIVAVAAQWINPEARGQSKLRPLTEGEKTDVLGELERSLATLQIKDVPPSLLERFKQYAPRDVEDLIPHLERRAQVLTKSAERKLTRRGEEEAAQMKKLLEEQRTRILEQDKESIQLDLFNYSSDELKQLEADRRHWRIRIKELEEEMETEPTRITKAYEVKATRVEPVGLIYLWPRSN